MLLITLRTERRTYSTAISCLLIQVAQTNDAFLSTHTWVRVKQETLLNSKKIRNIHPKYVHMYLHVCISSNAHYQARPFMDVACLQLSSSYPHLTFIGYHWFPLSLDACAMGL